MRLRHDLQREALPQRMWCCRNARVWCAERLASNSFGRRRMALAGAYDGAAAGRPADLPCGREPGSAARVATNAATRALLGVRSKTGGWRFESWRACANATRRPSCACSFCAHRMNVTTLLSEPEAPWLSVTLTVIV